MFYFDPAVIEQTRSDVLDGRRSEFTFAAPVFAHPRLHPLFNEMFAYGKVAESDVGMAAETSLLTFVAGLVRHSTSQASLGRSTADIRRARQRIDDDPTAPLSPTDLARDAGVSRCQLLRAFARELGLSPHAYIMHRRLAQARRLILAGMALADVAASCGVLRSKPPESMFRAPVRGHTAMLPGAGSGGGGNGARQEMSGNQ